jgi:hypothetical protein
MASGCSFTGNPYMDIMGLTQMMRWHENDFGLAINLSAPGLRS